MPKVSKKLFKNSWRLLQKILTQRRVWVIISICWPLIFIAPYHLVKWSTQDVIYDQLDQIPKKSIGLVLGTSKYRRGGGKNLFYTNRINATVKLYKLGKIKHILVSGDNAHKSYDEPTTILKDLMSQGVPREDITLDYAGFRTWDSIIRAEEIFGAKDYVIISQDFHLQRAVYIAQAFDQKVHGFEAPTPGGVPKAKMIIREHFARILMLWDLFSGNSPRFLGKVEHIHSLKEE